MTAVFVVVATLILSATAPQAASLPKEEAAPFEAIVSAPDKGGDEPYGAVVADMGEAEEASREIHSVFRGGAGYRFVGVDGFGGRAAPYDYLHSSFSGGLSYDLFGRDCRYSVDGLYLNEKDYRGEILADYRGQYRLHVQTESLFHNTEHEVLGPSFTLPAAQPRQYFTVDLDPLGRYGMKVEQDLAEFRYKVKDYPFHLNLGYWRMTKEGMQQLRFADQTFEALASTVYSRPRSIDRVTHQGTVGLDGHFGPVDVVYGFTIRQFDDHAPIPSDQFLTRNGGSLQHNEDPDSRYFSHTVKLHTSLDGGITGGASYTLTQRDNRSRLTDVVGADGTSSTLHNVAGDFAYTPRGDLTLGLKYRRQEVDPSTPSVIGTTFLSSPLAVVRPAFSTTRDVVTTTLSYRPTNLFTIKGGYRAEFLHRDIDHFADETLNWHGLPENSLSQKASLALLTRTWQGLRARGEYSYTTVDNPSYGTSPGSRHEGRFEALYSRGGAWGMTAAYHATRDENDQIARLQIASVSPVTYSPFSQVLARDKAADHVTATVWFVPATSVTISGSYGFLRNSIDQGILYTVVAPNAVSGVANYTSQAQYYAVTGDYRFDERLSFSLTLQQIRSFAEFDPRPLVVSAASDTSGIKEISRTHTVETSVSTRGEYRVGERVACSVDYTYRDYDEKYSFARDGSVHTVLASLLTRW